ncbi:S41 family peptidase [Flavobacterium sp. 7A]|uniref:S41 family peptidase n=1 Tax=Flavobacterium sp. 7A TaxID=2940571 RepID=UPI002225F986|nr:S41 family peptidase [Flavobacterium sp. 7A]MCW2120443.1 carboxyl-terminal processing protease [Flavobacterium sp. 7A]
MEFQPKHVPIIVGLSLAIGIVLGGSLFAPKGSQYLARNNSKEKLNKLIDFIENDYVDDVNTDSIVELTVDKIMSQLDPHSVYVPPKEQQRVVENMRGDFVGIGVNFYMFKDTLAVIRPVENGPSAKAGVKAGDRILYANNAKLFGRKLPSDSLYSKLKGKQGSDVALTIYRKSENKKITINLKRDVIPLKSVDASLLLNAKTGYIKINRFSETTYSEFRTALLQLKKLGMNTLILDLRDNGGGYMEKAIAIADDFLKEKQLIVFTKDKKGTIDNTYATKNGAFENGKVVVLINENSASASEILAGAIQDNDRGTIIGRRSFGKGLVQREMEFDDGSAVRLTVARYYTPTGRSIQKSYASGNESYFKESESRFVNGELYAKDSIKIADSLKFKTPKGRIVYGGGGIVPDVFVPVEMQNANVSYLMQSGIVGNFVFEQLDRQRSEFKGKSFDEFSNQMNGTERYFDAFQKFVFNNRLALSLSKDKEIVKRYLNAEFARQLYGENQYYQLLLDHDKMVQKVLGRQ